MVPYCYPNTHCVDVGHMLDGYHIIMNEVTLQQIVPYDCTILWDLLRKSRGKIKNG